MSQNNINDNFAVKDAANDEELKQSSYSLNGRALGVGVPARSKPFCAGYLAQPDVAVACFSIAAVHPQQSSRRI